ncbi:hypothetical protein Tco_1429467 [Tanacetum coccineum]
MYLKHHEKQVEDILNYLDELYLHRIERMEEGRINGNELKTELKEIRTQIIKLQKKRMPPKRTSTFETPAITLAAIRQLINDGISSALKTQAASMANTDNTNKNTGTSGTPVARKGINDHKRKSLHCQVSKLQQGGSSDQELQKQRTSHGKQPAISVLVQQKHGRPMTHRFRKSKYFTQVLSGSEEILLAVIKSSPGTTSGGGPKRQETMGDTIAQTRVLDLEKTKTTQQNEIASLKRRVKKLEQKKRSRTHGLKRLYKVGLTAKVESSGDEEDLEMFDVDTLNGEEVFATGQNENVVEEIVDAAQVSTATTTIIITTEEITLAQALANLKSIKPKAKGIAFREPKPEKPLKKKDQLKLDEEIALKLQEEINKEKRIARAEEEKIDEANIAWDDIQAKVDVDYQLAERLQVEEQEQFTIKEKATLFKELLEQKLFDKAFIRVNMFVDFRTELVEGSSKRAREELEQESTKKQKVDEDKDTTELQSLMEVIPDEEEVAIDVVPLATKSLSIID